MAYQAKRKKVYTEEFELVDYDGNVVHTLHVELDPDAMVKKLSEKYVSLINVLKEAQTAMKTMENKENVNQNLELFGKAIVELIESCFGKQDADTIVEFYKGRYMEMYSEVVPFIANIVIPEVRKIASQNKKEMLSTYNRKQRRTMFKKQ